MTSSYQPGVSSYVEPSKGVATLVVASSLYLIANCPDQNCYSHKVLIVPAVGGDAHIAQRKEYDPERNEKRCYTKTQLRTTRMTICLDMSEQSTSSKSPSID